MSRPKITVRGTAMHPRFMVQNGDEWFWDGEKFVPSEKDGLLYSTFSPASMVVRELMLKELEGSKTYDYVVPLQITVKAEDEPDIVEVAKWLYKTMRLEMDYRANGVGPVENSLCSPLIEWDQIKKVKVNDK